MYDLLIKKARIIDPESGRDFIGDLAVSAGKIAGLADELGSEAAELINGDGKILSPGFIDIHAHEDIITETVSANCLPVETAGAAAKQGITTLVTGNCGNSPFPVGEYRELLKKSGIEINTPLLVGNITLRIAAGAEDRYAPATAEQLAEMLRLEQQAFDEGALGISFGLEYCPGTDKPEILALAKKAAENGKIMAVHMRYDYPSKALETVKEVLEIAEETGVSLQISHFAANVYGCGNVEAADRLIQQSKARVSCDVYPYNAWATSIKSSVFDEGFRNFNFGVEDLEIVTGKYYGRYCTQELFDEIRSGDGEDAMVVCHNAMPPEDVDKAYCLPYAMMGSDSELMKLPQGIYLGHPRSSSAAVKFLSEYVRDRKLMDLMTGLAKLTVMPAEKLGLSNKGRLKPGADADLVLFDYEGLKVNAEFGVNVCALAPDGIEAVVVGGKRII